MATPMWNNGTDMMCQRSSAIKENHSILTQFSAWYMSVSLPLSFGWWIFSKSPKALSLVNLFKTKGAVYDEKSCAMLLRLRKNEFKGNVYVYLLISFYNVE